MATNSASATKTTHAHPINYKFTGTDKVSLNIVKALEYKSKLEKDLDAINSSLAKINKAYTTLNNDKNTKGDWKNWLTTNTTFAKKYQNKTEARQKDILNAILIAVVTSYQSHNEAGTAIGSAQNSLSDLINSL